MGVDLLQLGLGLEKTKTQINREGLDLILTFNITDEVRILNYFSADRFERIQFADGTVWDYAVVTGQITQATNVGSIVLI